MNTPTEELRHRLQRLHTLLSLTLGSDPAFVREVRAAIDFACGQPGRTRALETFPRRTPFVPARPVAPAQGIRRLVRLHLAGRPHAGFYWWDCGQWDDTPLWLHGHLLRGLNHLRDCRESLLLVSGLRQAICPPGRRWTRHCQKRWQEAIGWVETLAAARLPRQNTLYLLFA